MRFKIKNTMVLAGLLAKPFDRRLIMVLLWFLQEFGKMTMTEGWRDKRHPNDLHGTDPVRAIDLRSWEFKNPTLVAAKINSTWEYDPARPTKQVCVYHDVGEGAHFHIQVHPKTRMKGD
jgi:hypothetical protein